MTNETATERGVGHAFACWLEQHPISVPEIIEIAATKAIAQWLDNNEERLIAAISDKAAQQIRQSQ